MVFFYLTTISLKMKQRNGLKLKFHWSRYNSKKCLVGSDVCHHYGNHLSECVYDILPESVLVEQPLILIVACWWCVCNHSGYFWIIVTDFCPVSTYYLLCLLQKFDIFICVDILCDHTYQNNYFQLPLVFSYWK